MEKKDERDYLLLKSLSCKTKPELDAYIKQFVSLRGFHVRYQQNGGTVRYNCTGKSCDFQMSFYKNPKTTIYHFSKKAKSFPVHSDSCDSTRSTDPIANYCARDSKRDYLLLKSLSRKTKPELDAYIKQFVSLRGFHVRYQQNGGTVRYNCTGKSCDFQMSFYKNPKTTIYHFSKKAKSFPVHSDSCDSTRSTDPIANYCARDSKTTKVLPAHKSSTDPIPNCALAREASRATKPGIFKQAWMKDQMGICEENNPQPPASNQGSSSSSTIKTRKPPRQHSHHNAHHCLICDKKLGTSNLATHLLSYNGNDHGTLVEKNQLIHHLDQSVIENIKSLSTYTHKICAQFYELLDTRFKCKLCGDFKTRGNLKYHLLSPRHHQDLNLDSFDPVSVNTALYQKMKATVRSLFDKQASFFVKIENDDQNKRPKLCELSSSLDSKSEPVRVWIEREFESDQYEKKLLQEMDDDTLEFRIPSLQSCHQPLRHAPAPESSFESACHRKNEASGLALLEEIENDAFAFLDSQTLLVYPNT